MKHQKAYVLRVENVKNRILTLTVPKPKTGHDLHSHFYNFSPHYLVLFW